MKREAWPDFIGLPLEIDCAEHIGAFLTFLGLIPTTLIPERFSFLLASCCFRETHRATSFIFHSVCTNLGEVKAIGFCFDLPGFWVTIPTWKLLNQIACCAAICPQKRRCAARCWSNLPPIGKRPSPRRNVPPPPGESQVARLKSVATISVCQRHNPTRYSLMSSLAR